MQWAESCISNRASSRLEICQLNLHGISRLISGGDGQDVFDTPMTHLVLYIPLAVSEDVHGLWDVATSEMNAVPACNFSIKLFAFFDVIHDNLEKYCLNPLKFRARPEKTRPKLTNWQRHVHRWYISDDFFSWRDSNFSRLVPVRIDKVPRNSFWFLLFTRLFGMPPFSYSSWGFIYQNLIAWFNFGRTILHKKSVVT